MKKEYRPNLLTKLSWQLEKIQDFVRYRTYDKYHIIKTDLEPGYYDKDTLILEANFALLVSFVEKECATMELYSEKPKNWRFKLPRILRGIFYRDIRSRELGLKFIDWHINNELSPEEIELQFDNVESYQQYRKEYSAPWKEIKELYIWWKDVRPKREDPIEASGFSAYCDSRREKYGGFFDNMKEIITETGEKLYEVDDKETKEEKALGTKLAMLAHEIEEEQHKEDDDMLIRLIKVRRNLWT